MTKEEIRAMIQEEIAAAQETKEKRRTAVNRVMKDYDKRISNAVDDRKSEYNVRQAIYSVLRAVFRVDNVMHIPEEKEPEMRQIVGEIVGIIEEGQG